MLIVAKLLKIIFKYKFFKKYYFKLYTSVINPLKLFKNVNTTVNYGNDLKINLDVNEWIQQQIFFFGIYDINGISYLRNTLKTGDVFIDIGANIGSYSLIASELVKDKGKVISFEPTKLCYRKLNDNISLNKLNNIKTEKLAVYHQSGFINLHISNSDNLGMSSILHHDAEIGNIEKVETITLDKYIIDNKISKINLIKLDIEGAEYYALKGMLNTLEKYKPNIIIEISPDVLSSGEISRDDILNLLKSINYFPNKINENGEIYPFNEIDDSYYDFVFIHNTNI